MSRMQDMQIAIVTLSDLVPGRRDGQSYRSIGVQKTLVSGDPAVQKTDLYCTPENNSLKRRERATRKHEARTAMAATDAQSHHSANWLRSSSSQSRPMWGSGVRRLRGARACK